MVVAIFDWHKRLKGRICLLWTRDVQEACIAMKTEVNILVYIMVHIHLKLLVYFACPVALQHLCCLWLTIQ